MSCDRRIDSRVRLALAVIASLVIAALNSLPALLWLLASGAVGSAIAVLTMETRWRPLARRLLAVNGFLVFVWLTLPWELGPDGFVWSERGVHLATMITVRANAIALAVGALLAGMDAYAVARAGAALGLPVKFARLMLLMVRYVDVIADTWRRGERAARARGFAPGANRRTLVVLAHLLALLLVHALLRAERVDMALRARAFSGAFGQAKGGTVPRSHWAWATGTTLALLVALALPLWPTAVAWAAQG